MPANLLQPIRFQLCRVPSL